MTFLSTSAGTVSLTAEFSISPMETFPPAQHEHFPQHPVGLSQPLLGEGLHILWLSTSETTPSSHPVLPDTLEAPILPSKDSERPG